VHTLRSSNFPFYAAVWSVAKSCTGIVALGKRFYWDSPRSPSRGDGSNSEAGPPYRRYSALVDIVAQDGLQWIKVSTSTERRVLFDLAKMGWVGDSSSEESEDGIGDNYDFESEGLMKQAEALVKVSKATRVRYRHPEVHIVLPKIRRGRTKEVDELIDQIEALGIVVQTSEDVREPPPVSAVLQLLAVNSFESFSDIINVDCTILLAFVSDLSHSRVRAEDWHHRAVLRQIEMESKDQLLPSSLWPACGPKQLVCTREAATRMHEIVDLIGTESEKRRRDCIMDVESTSRWTREQRIRDLQALSAYNVPENWNIPIMVIDTDIESLKQKLPPVAKDVIKFLSPINQSVFLYGWATGKTTISSNRSVAKEIETVIELYRTEETAVGPDIWLCSTARSLVGKEKTRNDSKNVRDVESSG
jgi:Protein of unknown function (DUF1308)